MWRVLSSASFHGKIVQNLDRNIWSQIPCFLKCWGKKNLREIFVTFGHTFFGVGMGGGLGFRAAFQELSPYFMQLLIKVLFGRIDTLEWCNIRKLKRKNIDAKASRQTSQHNQICTHTHTHQWMTRALISLLQNGDTWKSFMKSSLITATLVGFCKGHFWSLWLGVYNFSRQEHKRSWAQTELMKYSGTLSH